MSRADKIRKMSDSELADFLCCMMPEDCDGCRYNYEAEKFTKCTLLEWLMEENDEDNQC